MSTAELSALKENLHHYIDLAEEKKIQAIYTLLEDEINFIEEYNRDIEEAEKDIAAGRVYTQEQVIEYIKSQRKAK